METTAPAYTYTVRTYTLGVLTDTTVTTNRNKVAALQSAGRIRGCRTTLEMTASDGHTYGTR